jgi:hypothetical protein
MFGAARKTLEYVEMLQLAQNILDHFPKAGFHQEH